MKKTQKLGIKFNSIFKLFFVFTFFTLISTNVCHGYTFTNDFNNGFYWESFPIKFEVIGSTSQAKQLIYDLVTRAQSEWENAVGQSIWDFKISNNQSSNSTNTKNTIRWSNNFAAETGFDPNVTLAVTTRYTSGTFVSKSDIILNANSAQLISDPGLLYRTILHEMGHTVGLDHSKLNAVMYPYITQHESPQPDDVDGINKIIDDTLSKQTQSFQSPLSQTELNKKIANCGSIDLNDKNGPNNFIFSLLIGVLALAAIRRVLFSNNLKTLLNFVKH